MGIVFRQSIKTTIVTFTGALLGATVLYLSTQYLPQQVYGFQKDLTFKAVVFSYIILLGLHSTLHNFILKYPVGDERRKILITISLLGPILMTGICIVPYMLLKEQFISLYQPKDQEYISKFFFWLPVYTLFWSYLTVLEGYLSSQMKVALSVFYKEIVIRVFNLIFLLLFAFDVVNLQQFLVGTIIAHIVPIGMLFYHSSKTEGFGIKFSHWKIFTRAEYKDLAYYAWYHILLNVSANLLGYIDSLMLASLDTSGMKTLAVYSTAVFIISFMQIPFRSMLHATRPVLTTAYHENDTEKLQNLFRRSSTNMFLVTMVMGTMIACNMHNAVKLIGQDYAAMTPVVFIFLIGRAADAISGPNTEVLSISNFYKYNFYISALLLVLVIILNRITIPIWGIYGAAWATTIAQLTYNLVKYFIVLAKLQLQPISMSTLKILIAGATAAIVGFMIPHLNNPILDTIIRTPIILLILAGLFILLRVSDDLNSYLDSVRQNKRLF